MIESLFFAINLLTKGGGNGCKFMRAVGYTELRRRVAPYVLVCDALLGLLLSEAGGRGTGLPRLKFSIRSRRASCSGSGISYLKCVLKIIQTVQYQSLLQYK